MNRSISSRMAAIGTALTLCLGLCACGSTQASVASDRGITVSATEHVSVVPDRCSFNVTVESSATNASKAQQANAREVRAVVDKLKELGIDEASIQTAYTDVSPSWDEDDPEGTYYARTNPSVEDVSVDEVGGFMDAAVEAGATEVSFMGYTSTQYQEAYQEALAKAIDASKAKAEFIAQASGVTLGEITQVTEGYQDMGYLAEEEAVLASSDAVSAKGTQITPGEVDITAEATVTFAIK